MQIFEIFDLALSHCILLLFVGPLTNPSSGPWIRSCGCTSSFFFFFVFPGFLILICLALTSVVLTTHLALFRLLTLIFCDLSPTQGWF